MATERRDLDAASGGVGLERARLTRPVWGHVCARLVASRANARRACTTPTGHAAALTVLSAPTLAPGCTSLLPVMEDLRQFLCAVGGLHADTFADVELGFREHLTPVVDHMIGVFALHGGMYLHISGKG